MLQIPEGIVVGERVVGEAEIDEDAVEKALARAQDSMKDISTPEEVAAVQVAIQKSLAQLHIKRRRKRV